MIRIIVLAVALLGACGPVLPACSTAPKLSERPAEDTRAARETSASELAEGLMARFVDHRWAMPDAGDPVAQGRDLYRWEILEQPAADHADSRGPALEAERAGNAHLRDRLRRVEVRVWLAEASGGSATFDAGVPHASLVRVIDPLAFSSPGSLQRLIDQPGGTERLMGLMKEMEKGREAAGAGG